MTALKTVAILLVLGAVALALVVMANRQPLVPITEMQAEAIVRSFERDSSIAWLPVSVEEWDSGQYLVPNPKQCYVLQRKTPETQWYIDMYSGDVVLVLYRSRFANVNDYAPPFGPHSKEECQAKALAFARSQYPGFDTAGFNLRPPEWLFGAWDFLWEKRAPNGAMTNNEVYISVNPRTCQVVRYEANRDAIPTPRGRPMSQAEAADIAFRYCEIAANNRVDPSPGLLIDSNGRMFYRFAVDGLRASGEHVNAMIMMNAVSGKVLEASYADLGGAPPSLPPPVAVPRPQIPRERPRF